MSDVEENELIRVAYKMGADDARRETREKIANEIELLGRDEWTPKELAEKIRSGQ